MVASNNQEAILQDVADSLAEIDGTSPFTNVVKKVERVERELRDRTGVAEAEMPWIGFRPEQEQIQTLPHESIRVVLPVTVVGFISSRYDQSQKERTRLATAFRRDIITALSRDIRRNNCAVFTRIVRNETDEGIPEASDHRNIQVTQVLQRWEIVYFESLVPA